MKISGQFSYHNVETNFFCSFIKKKKKHLVLDGFIVSHQLIRRRELSPLLISLHPHKKKDGNEGQEEDDKLPLLTSFKSLFSITALTALTY